MWEDVFAGVAAGGAVFEEGVADAADQAHGGERLEA